MARTEVQTKALAFKLARDQREYILREDVRQFLQSRNALTMREIMKVPDQLAIACEGCPAIEIKRQSERLLKTALEKLPDMAEREEL
jgi:hypothetical protein